MTSADAAAGLTVAKVRKALGELERGEWGRKYPQTVATWTAAWERFTPFLQFPPMLRRVIYTTNSIESLNYQLRKIIKNRGHFPNEQSAIKCLYMVTRSLDPKGLGQARWVTRWKPALNAFAITFADRFPSAENY